MWFAVVFFVIFFLPAIIWLVMIVGGIEVIQDIVGKATAKPIAPPPTIEEAAALNAKVRKIYAQAAAMRYENAHQGGAQN